MLTLYLVRHGLSTWNEQNRIQGNHNPRLAKTGKMQARRLARQLKQENISLIYSSHLLRCKETAQIIQKTLKVPLYYDKELREINLGDWEGKTPQQVNRFFKNGYQKWVETPSRVRIPGAEPVGTFRKRVLKTFQKFFQLPIHGNVLIVSHGGVITTLLAHLLKGSEDRFLIRLRIDNTGITVIRVKDKDSGVVYSINNTSHLKEQIASGWNI